MSHRRWPFPEWDNRLLKTPSPKSLFTPCLIHSLKNECEREKTEEKKTSNPCVVCVNLSTDLWGNHLFRATLRTSNTPSPTRWKRAPLITKLVISHKCQNQGPHLKQHGKNTALIPKRKRVESCCTLWCVISSLHYNVNNLGLWDYMQWLIKNHKGSCKIIFYGNDVSCIYF